MNMDTDSHQRGIYLDELVPHMSMGVFSKWVIVTDPIYHLTCMQNEQKGKRFKPQIESTCALTKQVVTDNIRKSPPHIPDMSEQGISFLHTKK